MASIINPSAPDVTNLSTVSVTAQAASTNNDYVPHRTLKNSVASTAPFGQSGSDFSALKSDIPDNFATTESPKTKFLFTVQFFPRSGLKLPETGSDDMDTMKFALKRAGRPQPQITYQDVNFYSFRTKVAIKLDYGTVALSFYDDVVNKAHNIVSQYINYVSPISIINKDQADNLSGSTGGARSIGAYLDGQQLGPFQAMRVTHHMLNNAIGADPTAAKQVYYDYLNPKIIAVNLDDLDMTQSEVSTVEVTFVYDSVNITYSDVASANPNTTSTAPSGATSPTIVAPLPAQGSSTPINNVEGWTPTGSGSNGTTGGFFGT